MQLLFYKEKHSDATSSLLNDHLEMVVMTTSHVMIILFYCHLQFGACRSSGATEKGEELDAQCRF
jgi:hypothetical protein